MDQQEIFAHLFSIAHQSKDTDGVVTSCLVRDGEIIADAVSAGSVHSEYALLQELRIRNIVIESQDIVYVTVQPCSQRSPGGEGEKLGDCAMNLVKAGVRHVVYAAAYPKSSLAAQRFSEAGSILEQTKDEKIIDAAIALFNATCEDPKDHLHR